jgi:hypothetical protein
LDESRIKRESLIVSFCYRWDFQMQSNGSIEKRGALAFMTCVLIVRVISPAVA